MVLQSEGLGPQIGTEMISEVHTMKDLPACFTGIQFVEHHANF